MSSPFADRLLEANERRKLLESLVQRARASRGDRSAVAVFDLDGTLIDNRPRIAAIVQQLATSWRDSHPDAAQRLASAQASDMSYHVADSLQTLGVEEPSLHEQATRYWHERFFTDAYIDRDVAMPGAVRFVQRLYDAGANIVYLTGRDLPNMALGTLASLRDLGFPIGVVGAELVLKPEYGIRDVEFKSDVAGSLSRLGEVLAVVDNEPANCDALLAACPSSVAVMVDFRYAPDPPPPRPEVKIINTFEI